MAANSPANLVAGRDNRLAEIKPARQRHRRCDAAAEGVVAGAIGVEADEEADSRVGEAGDDLAIALNRQRRVCIERKNDFAGGCERRIQSPVGVEADQIAVGVLEEHEDLAIVQLDGIGRVGVSPADG